MLIPWDRLLFMSLCVSPNIAVAFRRLSVGSKRLPFFISKRMLEVRGSFLLFFDFRNGSSHSCSRHDTSDRHIDRAT